MEESLRKWILRILAIVVLFSAVVTIELALQNGRIEECRDGGGRVTVCVEEHRSWWCALAQAGVAVIFVLPMIFVGTDPARTRVGRYVNRVVAGTEPFPETQTCSRVRAVGAGAAFVSFGGLPFWAAAVETLSGTVLLLINIVMAIAAATFATALVWVFLWCRQGSRKR